MGSSATVWPLDVTKVAVLADCHIHPGGGPAFPDALLNALAAEDVDLIVTLGDMGEAAGLDQLAEFAPVIGVRGQDDSDDPRTDQQALVLTTGDLSIGCVFDAVAAGLAVTAYPFTPSPDLATAARRLFGRKIDMLLHASTHRGEASSVDAESHPHFFAVFNPGSAVLPAEGARPSFVKFVAGEGLSVNLVFLD